MTDPGREARLQRLLELGELSQDDYDLLMASSASPIADKTGAGAFAQGSRSTAAGKGGIAVGGNVYGDIHMGEAPKDEREALVIYRSALARTLGHLSLRGLDVGASDASRKQVPLDLAHVYVDLDTTTMIMDRGRTSELLGDENWRWQLPPPLYVYGSERRPLPALEAVIRERRLVLLGDPGSGKSTFVNWLAYGLTHQAATAPGLPGWPQDEADLLPILVILRDYARSIAGGRPEPGHLWSFIASRLETQNLGVAAKPILNCLEHGRALVLFDGLDEVPTVDQRRFVRDVITTFSERYSLNRYLLTCRILSYQEPAERDIEDLRITGFPVYTLAPFDGPKIDRFIEAWYGELAQQGTVRTEDRSGLAERLKEAVRRPDLYSMAGNPLLLTVMALVHTHKGRLPDARAILYEDTVDLLLSRWEEQKIGAQETRAGLVTLLRQAGRGEIDLKRVLWRLAYEAQNQEAEGDQQLAGIPELSLQKALADLKKDANGKADLNWARDLMDIMKLRAGLLIERSPGVFTFPHTTFQEFLAGVYLTSEGDFACQAAVLADDASRWREVILLAVGYLLHRYGETSRPLALAAELCPEREEDREAAWRRAWLAGEVLAELGPRVDDSKQGRDLHMRIVNRLATLITQAKLAARDRCFVGETLARLGDPRLEINSVDAMAFCWVPEGPFLQGSGKADVLAWKDEQPQHEICLNYGYWLARYPVTVAQFRAYVEETGVEPEDSQSIAGPQNHPVVFVSWHQAVAFCSWLTERWQAKGWLPNGWAVCLPSESEWEKAARGGLDIPAAPLIQSLPLQPAAAKLIANPQPSRIYPWGEIADPERMNYYNTGVLHISAVGCFPTGRSIYGAEDMSGNVLEWTRSWFTKYSCNLIENFEGPKGRNSRVVRGGRYDNSAGHTRCASRYNHLPDCSRDVGFRVVVSSSCKDSLTQ